MTLILTLNFWRHSQDISGLFPNHFLYISQSVCQSLYLFQLVISGGQLLRPLVLFDYSSCMYLWQTSLDCISLKLFSACLVFMPTIRTANQKPPVIDIQPLKYYNSFLTTFLMIYLKQAKKINRLLGEPELPAEPSSLALTFLLSRAKPSELQSPKALTVGNVNKTDNRKDYVDNSQKKTEKHFKNVRELRDISNTDKETK